LHNNGYLGSVLVKM